MKRKRKLGIILAASVLVSVIPGAKGGPAFASVPVTNMDTWDGTADISWYDPSEDVFEITTAEQLAGAAKLSTTASLGNVSFKDKTLNLMNNLDLDGLEWLSIGAGGSNSEKTSFNGTFDGQGHVVYNLSTQESGVGHGLFGTVHKGTIKNLGVENADVYIPEDDWTLNSGILADWADQATISNCYTTGRILSERNDPYGAVGLGGLIGQCTAMTEITGCYSSAEVRCEIPVDSSDVVGGLVGQWETAYGDGTRKSRIQDCWFDGTIVCTSDNSAVGGILGANFSFSGYGVWMENCFAAPMEVSCDNNPANFCYIGAIDEYGTIKGCYFSEPDTVSGMEEHYYTGVQLVIDPSGTTASPDPDYVADVDPIGDPFSDEFLDKLNAAASGIPKIKWVRGADHPTFDWDKRNHIPDFAMTATASDAQETKLTVKSGMDGTLWYSIYENGSLSPVTGADLESIVNGQEGAANGNSKLFAGQEISFTAGGLKPDTDYTVTAGVKNGYGNWSDLVSVDIKTMKELLKGTVALSGFPVVGEELTAAVSGCQEDADLVYAWYRGNRKIDGEDQDAYILGMEDIGKKLSVEISANNYRGILVSDKTPEIAEEYTVTRIEITKEPQRVTYGIGEAFDRTGMEVKAYLKASSSNATPSTAVKYLAEDEYTVAPETFDLSGTVKVTVSYMGAEDSLNVTVLLDNLEGSAALSGDPVLGEKLTAETEGVQTDAKLSYSWYRDGQIIPGKTEKTYVLQKADVGCAIHAEVTASNYAGKLLTERTEKIKGGYTVSGIKVTKMPDKLEYKVKETFDKTGMEVTAFLKINLADQDPVKEILLTEGQYTVSCNLNVPGTALVTVLYEQDGLAYEDTFKVMVLAEPHHEDEGDGDDGDSEENDSGRTGRRQGQDSLIPVPGTWHQQEDGSWTFIRDDKTPVNDTWIYIANGAGADWYRFDGLGRMRYGWYLDPNGRWYYLSTAHDGSFGAMVTGWKFMEDEYWYYFRPQDGAMATGWTLVDNCWYYLNPVSTAETWKQEGAGTWQWTGSTAMPYGAMYSNTVTPDGWKVGADGAWIR